MARNLGLSKTDIEAIEYDYHLSLKEQIFQFFDKWKQCKGKDATVESLIEGLKAAELNEVLKTMQKAGFIPKGKMLLYIYIYVSLNDLSATHVTLNESDAS